MHDFTRTRLNIRNVTAALIGLAGLASAGLVVASASPARALDMSWRETCTYKASPQGYGEMIKERACMAQNYCQRMADAQGSPYTGNGCFMVPPSAAASAAPRTGHGKR